LNMDGIPTLFTAFETFQIYSTDEEWHVRRAALTVTASHMGDVCGVGYNGEWGAIERARYEVLPEYANDPPFTGNAYTRHGNECEPKIRALYETYVSCEAPESPFFVARTSMHDVGIGATPDALLTLPPYDPHLPNERIVAEFKAPVHTIYKEIPKSHMCQMQTQMALAQVGWCDYVAVCFATGDYLTRRVKKSAEWAVWIATCTYKYSRWLAMEPERLRTLGYGVAAAKMPRMPAWPETRPLFEMYPIEM